MLLNIGVAPIGGCILPYYMFDDDVFKAFSKENVDSTAKNLKNEIINIISVPVITLKELIFTYTSGVFLDFLQIDIEGLFYDVLHSYDFSRNAPIVICVEIQTSKKK